MECLKTLQDKISRVDNSKSEEDRVVILACNMPPGLDSQFYQILSE